MKMQMFTYLHMIFKQSSIEDFSGYGIIRYTIQYYMYGL